MKILIVSNEYTRNNRIGNPIVERIVHSTNNDSRVDCAYFIPFTNKISDLFKIRKRLTVGDIDVFHIHFGGLYALIIFVFICISLNISFNLSSILSCFSISFISNFTGL